MAEIKMSSSDFSNHLCRILSKSSSLRYSTSSITEKILFGTTYQHLVNILWKFEGAKGYKCCNLKNTYDTIFSSLQVNKIRKIGSCYICKKASIS